MPAKRAKRVWLLVTAVAALASCYDPKIESGSLHCAPPDNACPEGFACSAGVCVLRGDASVADHPATDTIVPDGGCANPVVPLCTPAAGVMTGTCDPVCQTGCPCGQRCSLASTGPVCVSPGGGKGAGQVCTPSADDCLAGYACLREACGSNLGRCYRFCRDASMCGGTGGVACTTTVNSSNDMALGQLACDLAEQTCDPLTGKGCPDPALGCFVTSAGHTICDCPGRNRHENESCRGYDDCAAGLACLDGSCVKLCASTADCPSCVALGNIRYCSR